MTTNTNNGYVYSLEAALVQPAQAWGNGNGKPIEALSELLDFKALKSLDLTDDAREQRRKYLADAIKDYSSKGYDFLSARASLALLAQSLFNPLSAPFTVLSCRLCERKTGREGGTTKPGIVISCAFDDKIWTHEEVIKKYPVHALSHALKTVLKELDPNLVYVHIEQKRKKFFEGKAGRPVCLRFWDECANVRWSTIGYSNNIFDAYVNAAVDGYRFRLDPRFKNYVRGKDYRICGQDVHGDPVIALKFVSPPHESQATRGEIPRQNHKTGFPTCAT